MKRKHTFQWLLITLAIAIIIDLIYVIYFTSGVSATFPPIKIYEYDGSAKQLVTSLKSYETSNQYLKVNIIDTLGDKSSGFGYEIIVELRYKSDAVRYNLKCVDVNEKHVVIIKLIGAHDLNNDTGGYGLKAKGMKDLLAIFDTAIINPLKNNYGIILRPRVE